MPSIFSKIFVLAFLFLFSSSTYTVKNNIDFASASLSVGAKLKIPVVAHRFKPSTFACDISFTWTATKSEIETEISATNQLYNSYGFNVELVLLEIKDHSDDRAKTMDLLGCQSSGYYSSYDADFWNTYATLGAINIFCVDSDSPSVQHAYFSSSNDLNNMVVLKFYNDGWSTMHELGHTFSLYHTFDNQGAGKENKTRDPQDPCYNADKAGDLVADTDATINLDFLNNSIVKLTNSSCDINENCNCSYTWVNTTQDNCTPKQTLDLNSNIWGNIMNYGNRNCSRIFTRGQLDRMWQGILEKIKKNQINFCLVDETNYCLSQIILSNENLYLGQFVQAKENISSSQIIHPQNQLTTYKANNVDLEIGFDAKIGSNLLINPETCSCN